MIITITADNNELITINTAQLKAQLLAAQSNFEDTSKKYNELREALGLCPGHTHDYVLKQLKETVTKAQNASTHGIEAGQRKQRYHDLARVVLRLDEKNPENFTHEHILSRAREMKDIAAQKHPGVTKTRRKR